VNKNRHKRRKALSLVVIAFLGVLAVGLGVVLVVGGIFVPATYLQPWSASYHKQFRDPRMQVVALALLAPSGHNMQPWTIRLDKADPHSLELYADPSRLTPAVDPLARQTMVSQGTFLAYLRLAAAHLGYSTDFALFPGGNYVETSLDDSMRTLPVARVTLTRSASARTADYPSLYRSDTNRAPYTSRQLSTAQERALLGLSSGGPASLRLLTDASDVRRLGQFGVSGTLIETRYAAATRESDRLFYGSEQA
jgi:hypothetical protein